MFQRGAVFEHIVIKLGAVGGKLRYFGQTGAVFKHTVEVDGTGGIPQRKFDQRTAVAEGAVEILHGCGVVDRNMNQSAAVPGKFGKICNLTQPLDCRQLFELLAVAEHMIGNICPACFQISHGDEIFTVGEHIGQNGGSA